MGGSELSQKALAVYREQGANLLTPATTIDNVPAGVAVSLKEVSIDPQDDSLVYRVAGKTCLSGVALSKLCMVAGVSVLDTKRTDDRKHPHYSEYTVTVGMIDPDGTRRVESGSKVVDLRDNAADGIPGGELAAMLRDAKQPAGSNQNQRVVQARKFIHEICESKARNRAVRKLLGVKSGYTPQELNKPFIVPKISIDASDPEAKRAMLAGMTGAANAMFSQPVPEKIVVSDVVPNGDPVKQIEEPKEKVNDEAMSIMAGAFKAGRAAGIKSEHLAALAKEVTGVARKEAVSLEGAHKIADAVAIRIEELASEKKTDDGFGGF